MADALNLVEDLLALLVIFAVPRLPLLVQHRWIGARGRRRRGLLSLAKNRCQYKQCQESLAAQAGEQIDGSYQAQ